MAWVFDDIRSAADDIAHECGVRVVWCVQRDVWTGKKRPVAVFRICFAGGAGRKIAEVRSVSRAGTVRDVLWATAVAVRSG